MKSIVLIKSVLCLFVLSVASPVYAAKGGEKGPSDKAYEHASDKASFKGDNPGKGNKYQKGLDKPDKDKDKDKEKKVDDKDKKHKGSKKHKGDKDSKQEKSLKKEPGKAAGKGLF